MTVWSVATGSDLSNKSDLPSVNGARVPPFTRHYQTTTTVHVTVSICEMLTSCGQADSMFNQHSSDCSHGLCGGGASLWNASKPSQETAATHV